MLDIKKIKIFIYFLFFNCFIFAKSNSNTQLIKSGHWLYDDLYTISSESKQSFFLGNQPLTIGELKFYLKDIPYEELSLQGKILYNKVNAFLNKNEDFFSDQELRFFINPRLNAEFYYKSNPDIDWSFNYNYKDFALTIPIIIGFSDFITIEPDLFLGKNYFSSQDSLNFTNIPLSGSQFEFLTPRFAYGSTGYTFDNWGINFHVGKEGMEIGSTQLGSIIYNNTFETDAYFQLNLFTKWLKYTMDVVQVSNSKFFYIHQLDIRLFKNLKFGMIEGSLLNSSFELRYLNPFMLMHQYGSWLDYGEQMSALEQTIYGEGHFCAYLAFTLDYVPIKNLRIYALYAQNEILDLGESHTDADYSVPDSLGGQLGIEISLPTDNGYVKPFSEVLYTSPYLYVKQSPEWSLYRSRYDMQSGEYVNTWIGSPFGPDCFAVKIGLLFTPFSKWKYEFNYLFRIHGENTVDYLFSQYSNINGEDIYTYYPSVEYELAESEEEKLDAKNIGRYMWMTGTKEYMHRLTLDVSYSVFDNFSLYSHFVYTMMFNCSNIKDYFSQGVEVTFGVEYILLK